MIVKLSLLFVVEILAGSILGRYTLPGSFEKSKFKGILFLGLAILLAIAATVRAWQTSTASGLTALIILIASGLVSAYRIKRGSY